MLFLSLDSKYILTSDRAKTDNNSFSHVDSKRKVPVRAAYLCWAIIAILGCIYVGSSTAFNALIGSNIVLANISYGFPIFLLFAGRRTHMAPSTFPLGRFLGPLINGLALTWIIFVVVFFSFPFVQPVSAQNMSMYDTAQESSSILNYHRLFVRYNWSSPDLLRSLLGCGRQFKIRRSC